MEDMDDPDINEHDVIEVIELNDDQEIEDDSDDGDVGFNCEDDDEECGGGECRSMEAVSDDADVVFNKHTASVFCCDLEPTVGNLAVSGAEDDKAYVWNTTNGEVLFECKDHMDSVTCASFSFDGTYVATGDMSGIVKVWETASKNCAFSFKTADLAWLKWHQRSNVLLAGTCDGEFWMWRIPSGECKTFFGHGKPTGCCEIMADGKRSAVGYGDGSVRIWDLKTVSVLRSIVGESAHDKDVTCIDGHHDNVLLLSGAVDGTAKLINSVSGQVLATFECSLQDDRNSQVSVETVGFYSKQPIFATGTLNGQLGIWDVPSQVQRQVCKHETGIVRLVWDHSSPLVYTVGLDGAVRLWDARNGKLEAHWTGHDGEILDVVLSRDGSTILTASDDKTCRVFHVSKPDR